jgi:hypothetical protein
MALAPTWLTLWLAANEVEVPLTREQAKRIAEKLAGDNWRLWPASACTPVVGVKVEE